MPMFHSKVAVVLLILFCFNASAQDDWEPPELAFTHVANEEQFYLELINKSDPELQAVGLSYWDYNYDALIHDKKTLKLMNKTSEKLAQMPSPSLTTLKYLLEVCNSEKGIVDCDADEIMAKQMALYPDDAVVYLAPLQHAMNDGNEADVFYLINQMAKANSVQFSTYDSKNYIKNWRIIC